MPKNKHRPERRLYSVQARWREMQKLDAKGFQVGEIAHRLRVSVKAIQQAKKKGWVPETITRIRKERGLDKPNRPPLTISTEHELIQIPTRNTIAVAEKWKQMKAFYESGASLNEIGRIFKTDPSVVLNAKKKNWVPLRLGKHPNKKEIILLPTRNARTEQIPSPYNDNFIVERYQEGVGVGRVARECRTPASYIRNLLQARGLMRPSYREKSTSRFLNHKELNLIHMRLKLPLDRQKEAVQMYRKGATTRQVAKHFRVTAPLVSSLLKKFGIEPRITGKTKLPDKEKMNLLKSLKAGESDKAIAKRFRLTPIMIRYYIRRGRLAWQKRPEFEGIMKELKDLGIVY